MNIKTQLLKKYRYKKYYSGHIRWMIVEKNGGGISCHICGNIANGLVTAKIYRISIQIPYCKAHLSEMYFKKFPDRNNLDFPCNINFEYDELLNSPH